MTNLSYLEFEAQKVVFLTQRTELELSGKKKKKMKSEEELPPCVVHKSRDAKYCLIDDPNFVFCKDCALNQALQGLQITKILHTNSSDKSDKSDQFHDPSLKTLPIEEIGLKQQILDEFLAKLDSVYNN